MNKVLNNQASKSRRSFIVTKAVVNACQRMDIAVRDLAKIIGVSAASASRMKSGDFVVNEGTKPYELSVLLIRMYRSLDAITGGDDRVAASWLQNENTALGGVPAVLIKEAEGLGDVLRYLDCRRAPV